MPHDPRYAAPVPDSDGEGITLRGILGTVRRRWVLMLLVGLPVAVGFAALAYLVAPAPYRAFATLRIAAVEPRLVFSTAQSGAAPDFETYHKTQVAMIRSRYVLNAALRDPEISALDTVRRQPDPVAWLEEELIVDSPNSPEILRVALEGNEPTELAAIVNAVRDAYLDEVVNVERQQRRTRLADLERIYADTEEKVRLKEERVADLARSLGTGDSKALTIKQQMALEYFGQLQREHSRVRFELMQEQVRHRTLGPNAGLLDRRGDRDGVARPGTTRLDERIAQLEATIDRFERWVDRPDHPSLHEYRRELASLRARVEVDVDDDGRPIAENRLAVLERQEKALREELDEYAALVDEIGTGSFALETMKTDIDQVADIAERVGTEMETLRIELESPARVKPLEEAEVPTVRDSGKQVKLTAAAAVLGFGLVAALFVVLDLQSDHVSDADEMGERTGIPVLGSLPSGGAADAEGTSREEALDAARNLLLHRAELAGQHVLLVTAPTRSEGHGTMACDLAESLARSGRSTVLVDLDTRQPVARERFGLAGTSGLGDALAGETSLASAVQWTSRTELAVVTAGQQTEATLRELARLGPRPMFDQLRETFDVVVVNGGPILTDANATLLARGVDGVVLAIRRDVSQMPRVQEARRRLGVLEVPVLGAIVVPERAVVAQQHAVPV